MQKCESNGGRTALAMLTPSSNTVVEPYTSVTVGAAAALSVRHATKRWSWFSTFARRAPYFSGLLLIGVGLYVGIHGWMGLSGQSLRSPQAALISPLGG